MKKILALLFTVSLAFGFSQETETGIHFEHSTWKEILAKAKKENKLVMLDAYTSWCGPCKWMVKNIFPLKEVGEFYNKNFVNAKIDMEKGEGVDIAKKYNVMNYPTYLFVDGDGKLVHRVCGSREADYFIKVGKDAIDPKANFSALEKNYRIAENKTEAAGPYFNAASEACMDVEKDVTAYLDTQKPANLTQKENYNLIMNFINDHNAPAFKYMLGHYSDFTAVYSKDDIDAKIKDVYSGSLKKAVRSKDPKALAAIQEGYRGEKNTPIGYLDAYSDLLKAKVSGDTALYFKAIINITDNYLMADANQLNSNAWDFYEKTENKTYLLKAETWAKKSTELAPGYANFDTHAAILFKLGKYPEAKEKAQKAIDAGKKGNEDVKETEQLLEKINEKLKV